MTENIDDIPTNLNSPESDNSQDFANPQNENSHLSRHREESDSSVESGNGPESNNDKGDSSHNDDDSPDTFPREYVEKLRDENAKYRQRAQRSDQLAQRLHTALVEATGSLQDPTDLAFDESHLDDPEALQQAIDELLAAKPHLAARRPRGDVGQGQTGTSNTVDLAEMLRSRA